jgi:GTP pyrophosphokinase
MLESSDPSTYTNAVQKELDEIFVFTPDGDLKQLPKGASVLDFAFNIHSNLGVKCSGAKVNGKIASIKDELHTGDVVEIMSNKNQKPSADWLKIVVSSKARNRIKAKLKEEENKLMKLGREMLERRMKNWKLELNDDVLADIAKHYRMKASAEVFLAIYQEKIDLLQLKDFLTKGEEEESVLPDSKPEKPSAKPKGKSSDGDYLIISDKLNNISFSMAKCCNPIFGDDVFGFVSATGGIKIHRISCPNASRLIEKYPYRLQKVKWRQVSNTTQFQTGLRIIGDGDTSIGAQLIECITKQEASMRSFNITERRKPGNMLEFVAEIGISVGNNAHLDRVTSALRKIREVKTVLRTSQK